MSVTNTNFRFQANDSDPYLTQRITSASPEQLIAYIYDAILVACTNQDQERALRGLMALIDSLNFDYQDIALPMFQLYQYCLDQVRRRNYEEVKYLIGEFKTAWAEAMNVK